MIEEQKKILLHEFIKRKVCKATFALPKHKAQGVDGIPMEFFHELWLEVGKDMINLFQETFHKNSINKDLNISLSSQLRAKALEDFILS
jgi:hypothetical protein